jgi:hypothetical protein
MGLATTFDNQGEFKENLINGFGKYVWTSGKVYEGDWLENKMSGQGKMCWPDGKVYEGGFLDDKRHGKAKLISSDGKVTEGVWNNGKIDKKNEFERRTTKSRKHESKKSIS